MASGTPLGPSVPGCHPGGLRLRVRATSGSVYLLCPKACAVPAIVIDSRGAMLETGTVVELFAESLSWQLQAEPPGPNDRLALQAWCHGRTPAEVADLYATTLVAIRSRLRRAMWSLLAPTLEAAAWHGILVGLLFPIPRILPPFDPSSRDRHLLAMLARGQTLRRGLPKSIGGGMAPGTLRWEVIRLRRRCGAIHNGHLLALASGWHWLDDVAPVWALPPDYAAWGPERQPSRRRQRDPRRLPSDDWLDDLDVW